MKNYTTSLFSFFLIIILGSCTQQTSAVKQSSLALQTALESQQSAAKMLDKISQQAESSLAKGRIDSSTYSGISTYLATERIVVEDSKKELQIAQAGMNSYKTKRSAKKQGELLQAANKAVAHSSERIRILEKKSEVIVDFLGSETFSKSEIGALFRSGEYQLIKEQVKEGTRLFKPIVEKLFVFSDKYKDSFSSLKGEIIVTGYSDASAVEKGSALYADLSKRLIQDNSIDEPTSQDLNQKLSELRAGAVRDLLEKIIAERNPDDSGALEIKVRILGRGEQMPPFLEKATKNDHRRRVVTFYWVVLPGL